MNVLTNIGPALLARYPNANPVTDFQFVKNQGGDFSIVLWNEAKLGPLPPLDVLEAEAAALEANPPRPRKITPREFRKRFTEAEQDAMYLKSREATQTGAIAYRLLLQVAEAQEIDLDHPEIGMGVDFWISIGIVQPQRKAVVLA